MCSINDYEYIIDATQLSMYLLKNPLLVDDCEPNLTLGTSAAPKLPVIRMGAIIISYLNESEENKVQQIRR